MQEEYNKEYPHQLFIKGFMKFRSDNNFVLDLNAQAFKDITKFDFTFCRDIIDSIGSAASKIISKCDTWKSNEYIELLLINEIVFKYIQSSPIISLSFKSLDEAEKVANNFTKSGMIVEINTIHQKMINQINQILKNKNF